MGNNNNEIKELRESLKKGLSPHIKKSIENKIELLEKEQTVNK